MNISECMHTFYIHAPAAASPMCQRPSPPGGAGGRATSEVPAVRALPGVLGRRGALSQEACLRPRRLQRLSGWLWLWHTAGLSALPRPRQRAAGSPLRPDSPAALGAPGQCQACWAHWRPAGWELVVVDQCHFIRPSHCLLEFIYVGIVFHSR